MKRRSPICSNKKNKIKNNDKEVSQAVGLFRNSFKEHLAKLTQSGMPFRKASNFLINKLLSPESKLNVRENIDEIQAICSRLGGNTEEAIHAFLIKREITQLKLIGFSTLDAVNELINRLNNNNNNSENNIMKQKLKKRQREELTENESVVDLKKSKTTNKEKDESVDIDYSSPDYNFYDTSKSTFNPFRSNFINNTSRKKYFMNNRLKFADDVESNSGEEEEEISHEEAFYPFRNDNTFLTRVLSRRFGNRADDLENRLYYHLNTSRSLESIGNHRSGFPVNNIDYEAISFDSNDDIYDQISMESDDSDEEVDDLV